MMIKEFKIATKKSLKKEIDCSNSENVVNFIRKQFSCIEAYEEFFAICVNNANKVVGFINVGKGDATHTIVDRRTIVKCCLDSFATGVILVHNHPSGHLTPSGEDKQITQQIKECLKFFDVRLLDHIIVSKETSYSFYNNGLL